MNFSLKEESAWVAFLARLAAGSVLGAALAGCSAANSSLPFSATGSAQPLPVANQAIAARPAAPVHSSGMRPANCIPSVWASSQPNFPQPSVVVGYTGASPCITLTGGNAILFSGVFGLATDAQGYLYAADYNNHRVVVFDKLGNYWSTLNLGTDLPLGICVSTQGIVGVTTETMASVGAFDFFKSKGPQNSLSTPYSTVPASYGVFGCAFDKRGDFFASVNQQIAYLRNYNVPTVNPTLQICTSAICTGAWFSMYSHIRPITVNTLSAENWTGGPDIVNFRVNLGPPNQLNFLPWVVQPITALSSYPTGGVTYQIAPTTGQNNASKLYLADYLNGAVDQVTNVTTGGPVNPFVTLTSAWGVATHPTGQY